LFPQIYRFYQNFTKFIYSFNFYTFKTLHKTSPLFQPYKFHTHKKLHPYSNPINLTLFKSYKFHTHKKLHLYSNPINFTPTKNSTKFQIYPNPTKISNISPNSKSPKNNQLLPLNSLPFKKSSIAQKNERKNLLHSIGSSFLALFPPFRLHFYFWLALNSLRPQQHE
jgi:hypothetical protein